MNIRKATALDIPALLSMGRAMHAESPRFSPLSYSDVKVYELIDHLFRTPKAGGILVAEHSGEVVGMVVFFVAEHFFGGDKFASDLCVYVTPEYRGGSAFTRLVYAFEKWADDLGVTEKLLGVSTGIHTEQTVRMLERLGYERYCVGLKKV